MRSRRMHAFLEVIAQHLRHAISMRPLDGVVVVAPARILKDLAALTGMVCPVLATAPRDLIKADDHQLAALPAPELLLAETPLKSRPGTERLCFKRTH